MLATEDEQDVYYLTREMSFVFAVATFGTQVERLDVELGGMVKARYFGGFVFVLVEEVGVLVFKLDKKGRKLVKVQTVKTTEVHQFIDLQIDPQN